MRMQAVSVGASVIVDNPNRRRWNGKAGKVVKLMPDGMTLEVRMEEGPFAMFEECELLIRRDPATRNDIITRLRILLQWQELTTRSPMLDDDEREAMVVGTEGTKSALRRLADDDKADVVGKIELRVDDIYPLKDGDTAILPPADQPKDFDWEDDQAA